MEDPDEQVSDDSEQEATPDIDDEETTDVEEYEEEAEEVDLEEDDEDPEEDDEELEDDEDGEEGAEVITDEAEVEITIDGEVHRASVKDLKRLYGQEASLTRKSQAVAQQRKQAEDAFQKTDVVLQAMLKKAEERWQPYSEVDMLVASKTMDDADFAALRKEAQLAQDDLRFLKEEADNFYQDMQSAPGSTERGGEGCESTPGKHPGLVKRLYNDIRAYAVSQGIDSQVVDSTVDPIVIQLLNKARLYDRGKTVATVKKKAATKKKVLRSQKAPPTAKSRKKASVEKARQALRNKRGADLEDVASVLMARWET